MSLVSRASRVVCDLPGRRDRRGMPAWWCVECAQQRACGRDGFCPGRERRRTWQWDSGGRQSCGVGEYLTVELEQTPWSLRFSSPSFFVKCGGKRKTTNVSPFDRPIHPFSSFFTIFSWYFFLFYFSKPLQPIFFRCIPSCVAIPPPATVGGVFCPAAMPG